MKYYPSISPSPEQPQNILNEANFLATQCLNIFLESEAETEIAEKIPDPTLRDEKLDAAEALAFHALEILRQITSDLPRL